MATEYINPDYDVAGGASDGTAAHPWVSWSEITPASGNTYLQKLGTIDTITFANGTLPTTITFTGSTNTLGYYTNQDGVTPASNEKPIIQHYIINTDSAGWDQPDATNYPNVWRYIFSETANANRDLLAIGTLDRAGMVNLGHLQKNTFIDNSTGALTWANAPNAEGEFDSWGGSAGLTARTYMYSVGNPVTKYGTIYMTCPYYPPIQIATPVNVEVKNIIFQYCDSLKCNNVGDATVSGTFNIHHCKFTNGCKGINMAVGYGGSAYIFDGYKIHHNSFTELTSDPINISGTTGLHKNGKIYKNTIDDVGYANSSAGIYVGNSMIATAETAIRVYDNDISRVKQGSKRFPYDGTGTYADTTSQYVWFYGNRYSQMKIAHKDNTGYSNNHIIGNRFKDCDIPIQFTDQFGHAASTAYDKYILLNTFYNCGSARYTGEATYINNIIMVTRTTINNYYIKGNAFIGYDAAASVGISIGAHTVGSIVESNNSYYNVVTEYDGGSTTNPITTDPLINSFSIKPSALSDLIASGPTNSDFPVNAMNFTDAEGKIINLIKMDIGCYQNGARMPSKTRITA